MSKNLRSTWPILVLILLNLVVGIFLVNDFGQSWDEGINYVVGERYASFYRTSILFQDINETYYHGPFYFMIWAAFAKFFRYLNPYLFPFLSVARHFTTFITFQVAIFAFYFLCRFLMGVLPAIIATLLFYTQPLLFGHSFINQKDIPFLTFFLITVTLGLFAVDRSSFKMEIPTGYSQKGMHKFLRSLKRDWHMHSRRDHSILVISLGLSALLLFDLFKGDYIRSFMVHVITNSHNGLAPRIWVTIYQSIASDAYKTPLEIYLNKFDALYFWGRFIVALIIFALFNLLVTKNFRTTNSIYFKHLKKGFVALSLAAISLGLTISIRVIGPFSGVLVSTYALIRNKRRAIFPLISYWLIALITTYFTWPTLWGNPIEKILQRFLVTASFPPHPIFFEGRLFNSHALPWYYVPKLIFIQFTEPALALALVGMLIGIGVVTRKSTNFDKVLIFLSWFFVPLLAQVIFRTPIYGNFRHLLFIIPPLFLFSGLSLNWIITNISQKLLIIPLILAVIIPGIIGIYKTHPYEYIFYNVLVGGSEKAIQSYELDRFCTSYRAAMEYVNANASENAVIKAWGPSDAAREFARKDLIVGDLSSDRVDEDADYILVCGMGLYQDTLYPNWLQAFRVKIGDIELAIVKRPPTNEIIETK